MRWRRGFIVLVLPGVCAAGPASPSPSQTLSSIRTLIGDAGCDGDQQCRTVAVGSKACGGPELYLAWSSLSLRDDAINSAVANYRSPSTLEPTGRVSTCSVVRDPGAHCVARSAGPVGGAHAAQGVCRLREGRPPGALPPDR